MKGNLKILAFIRKMELFMGIKLHNSGRFNNGITWFYLLFPVHPPPAVAVVSCVVVRWATKEEEFCATSFFV